MENPSPPPGLRLLIVMALAGLMALAFVPLYFAVVELTGRALRKTRDEAALTLGRAVATHVGQSRRAGVDGLRAALEGQTYHTGVESVCVYGPSAVAEMCAGDYAQLPYESPYGTPYASVVRGAVGPAGRVLEIAVAFDDALVLTRVRADDATARAAPLARIVALYMGTFALALLTFTYFALTYLIVRPIDALSQAANRVARGARALVVPRAGAREIAALGETVQAMTTRLVTDEAILRSKLEELTRTSNSLTETRQQLVRSERLASVGRLAAGIAHEIGNPIAAIMGMEDLLLDGDLAPVEQRDFLQRMRKETDRIHTVVRDLLDFARPERDLSFGSAREETASVGDVLESVAALLAPQKTFKSVKLLRDVAEPCPRVRMSEDQLTQVVLNLALNAGDAIAAGASSATAHAEGTVTLRARQEGAFVTVEVEDTGPGVPPSLAARVFDPFVTTKEVGKGTGLGLAVCRGLVESAGGEIGIRPREGAGACFFVRLPAAP